MIGGALTDHLREIMESGEVSRSTKELCAAMTAAVNFCTPLLVEHRRNARALGVTVQKLNDLWDFARSEHFDAAERAALSAAVALSREPRALPPAVWSRLRGCYGQAAIVEILCVVGALNALARVRNAIDSEPAAG